MSCLSPIERENLKLIGFFTFFACLLHTNLVPYDILYSLDYYGWLFCAIGYAVNLNSKLTLPLYGVLHHPEGPLHWLLRLTVALFICLVMNSDFGPFSQFLLFLFGEICLFVKVTVNHRENGGREIVVDIL